MKQLDTFAMYRNIEMATDNKTDLQYFYNKACRYLESPDYTPELAKRLIETAYESIMVRIALETMADRTERYIFYIENGITVEVAEMIEEAILPLLEKYKREGK
jgi:hypothetical protein